MKKKILLMLTIVAVLMCLFAIAVSAETPAMYIEFGARFPGSADYITVYTENAENSGNPKIDFANKKFYSDVDFTQEVDMSTATGIDFSVAKTYANGVEGNAPTRMQKPSSPFVNCTEVKWFLAGMPTVSYNGAFFKGWTGLKYFDFGNATAIADNTFENCGFEELVIPATITKLASRSFANNKNLKSVVFEGATELAGNAYAFADCTALESVVLGNVTYIGKGTFSGCTALPSIELPSTVTDIRDSAFNGCAALTSINIPSLVTNIGSSAFRSCVALTEVTLPSGLTSLGKAAFYQCTELVSVYNLENTGVTWLGETFLGCTKLSYVRLPKGLVTLESNGDGTFYNCKALTTVGDFPSTLTYIGKKSFANSGLSGVLDLSVCTSLTKFEGSTFAYCNISKAILPSSITDLGDHTFVHCKNLEEIVGLENINVNELKGNLIEGITKVQALWLPMNPSDGMLEVGNLLWDRSTPITIYIANNKVALNGIFHKTSSNITFVYCGNDYEAFLNQEGNSTVKTNVGANIFPAGAEVGTAKYSLIYGNNICATFFGGNHAMSGNDTMQFNGFFESITFADVCTREGCGNTVVDESKTIGAIFTWKGFSVSKFADANGCYSVTQGFYVDMEAIKAYAAI
ncbi:MAG: leucine-rich repeat domain-containing protein, partial [Clostridia bacterium]|nr:leucine-rich repeat domain-containing protein [Clostridia bacterium]